jgi:hypothetical protein
MLFFSIFCLLNLNTILCQDLIKFEKVLTTDSTPLLNELSNYISQVLNITLTLVEEKKSYFSISNKCINILSTVLNIYKKIALEKLILDSSKVPNDISGYKDCLYNYYSYYYISDALFIKNNLTYIIFSYVTKNINEDNFNVARKSIFGLCIPKGCSDNDYRYLVYNALVIMYNDTNIFPGLVAYNIDSQWTFEKFYKHLLYFIPFYILILFTCFSFFNEYFFNESSLLLSKIKSCFNLGENVEEIFRSNISLYDSNLFNSSGLSIINGLRALSIFLFILGSIFEIFFRSPIANDRNNYENLCENPLFSFMAFCQRFGNKFCFCLSGFTISYKFLCYLDNKIDFIEHNSNDNNCFDNNNSLNVLYDNNNYKIYRKKITWNNTFLLFILKNFYKYILIWFYAFFYKYNFFPFINFFSKQGPFWTYFEREILHFFSFDTMFGMEIFQSTKSKFFYLTCNPFQVAINEINGFIFWTVIIFYFYKNNFRLDLFLIVFIIISSILKFFFFCYSFFFTNMGFFPSKSFMLYLNNYILISFPYNIVYFSIGVLFGLMNYSFQNSYIQNSSKNFITIPTKIIIITQKHKKLFIFSSLISNVIFFPFSYFFLYLLYSKFNKNLNSNDFLDNFLVNLFYLFDNEIILFLIFLSVFSFILSPDSKIIIILKHHYFCAISRPYFTIILCTGLICYYVMYQNDSQILLESQNILFYSTLCIFIILFIGLILFIFVEVPLKKLTKVFSSSKFLSKCYKTFKVKDNISTTQSSFSFYSNEIEMELNEIKNY